jgi:hypothetical protein
MNNKKSPFFKKPSLYEQKYGDLEFGIYCIFRSKSAGVSEQIGHPDGVGHLNGANRPPQDGGAVPGNQKP